MFRTAIVLMSAIIALPASAVSIKGIAGLSADFGGDQLMPSGFVYTDNTKPNIEAGRGLDAWGGVVVPVMAKDSYKLELQATVGYKFTTIVQANNGNVTWTHVPINVALMWRPGQAKFGLGAGISYQLNNALEGTGVTSSVTADYDNALGYQVIGDWMLGQKFSVFAKYQLIEYKRTSDGFAANGNNTGIGLSMNF